MAILIFAGLPIAIWLLMLLLTGGEVIDPRAEIISDPPEATVGKLVSDGAPRFALDYSGRLWVEKKRKGFFRFVHHANLPPEKPG